MKYEGVYEVYEETPITLWYVLSLDNLLLCFLKIMTHCSVSDAPVILKLDEIRSVFCQQHSVKLTHSASQMAVYLCLINSLYEPLIIFYSNNHILFIQVIKIVTEPVRP